MEYKAVAEIAQTWGLVYMVALFVGVLIYAFRPGAKKTFDRAAETALRED